MKTIQRRKSVNVRPDTPFDQIVALMTTHQLSALPVVDGRGRTVGTISMSDLLRRPAGAEPEAAILAGVARRRWYHQPDGVTARDLMASSVTQLATHSRSTAA